MIERLTPSIWVFFWIVKKNEIITDLDFWIGYLRVNSLVKGLAVDRRRLVKKEKKLEAGVWISAVPQPT